jgi:NADH dehydrogenase [ubiquinone] 1 alpha subcomplex assembly factor 6
MAPQASLVDLLRRHDRDRYLCALFAPADRRAAVIALYAFNYEIAKTREVVSEALLGRIRLQWWREAIEEAYGGGAIREHEVMTPLASAIQRHRLSREHFDAMIDARELDLDDAPPASMAALEDYCAATSGRLQRLALEALDAGGEEAAEAAREVGIAYALVGLIRAIPFHARARRSFIPADVAAEVGLDLAALFELKPSPALPAAVECLAGRASQYLASARSRRQRLPRHTLPALMPAQVASGYLRDIKAAYNDPFAPRVAARESRTVLRLAWGAATRRY